MAKLFQVTLPAGMSNVKLDSQGHATVQYTAKNVSARVLDGRGVLISLPQAKPPSGPVEKGWVKIDGKPDRHFDINKEETFTVKIAVPPKTPPGDYTFRLDTVWVDQTDQGDSGAAVKFTVPVATNGGGFPMWVIPVALLVVIGIGVGVWLALRGGLKVPDLHGQSVTDATNTLQAVGLTLDNNTETIESKPEDSGKIVSQVPTAGEKASKGQTVKVTVGTQMVTVPLVIGHPFTDLQNFLASQPGGGLTVGKSTSGQNPNFAGGIVFAQDPQPGTAKKAGTPVDVQVTPQMVPVPNITGQTLGSALNSLRANFAPPTWSGDSTKTVVSTNPAAGASVPIGSPIAINFPPGVCGPGFVCIFQGAAARQMVLEQTLRVQRGIAPNK